MVLLLIEVRSMTEMGMSGLEQFAYGIEIWANREKRLNSYHNSKDQNL
jgi:hypothetical protein